MPAWPVAAHDTKDVAAKTGCGRVGVCPHKSESDPAAGAYIHWSRPWRGAIFWGKGEGILYRFEIARWGLCQIETSTSGKFGFGLPKQFKITSCEGAFRGVHTFRFTNRISLGAGALEQKNADLIRLAIMQFIEWQGDRNQDVDSELDLTLRPFRGDVTNRHGRIISEKSLLPRSRADQCRKCLPGGDGAGEPGAAAHLSIPQEG